MNESERNARKRKRHIKMATQINKQHADVLKNKSEERKARSHIQIMGELISNKNVDYRRHMRWMR